MSPTLPILPIHSPMGPTRQSSTASNRSVAPMCSFVFPNSRLPDPIRAADCPRAEQRHENHHRLRWLQRILAGKEISQVNDFVSPASIDVIFTNSKTDG